MSSATRAGAKRARDQAIVSPVDPPATCGRKPRSAHDAFMDLVAVLPQCGDVSFDSSLLEVAVIVAGQGVDTVQALSAHCAKLESERRCAVQQVIHQGGGPELLAAVLATGAVSINGCGSNDCSSCIGGYQLPIHKVAEKNAADLIPLLLHEDGSIPKPGGPNYDSDNDYDVTPIREAVERDSLAALRVLARAKNAPLDDTFQSLEYATMTLHALRTDRLEAALILIEAGATVGAESVKAIQKLPEGEIKTGLIKAVFDRM